MRDPQDDELWTTMEVASLFGVTTKTVRDWVRSGKLSRVDTPGGRPRFRGRDVRKFYDDGTDRTREALRADEMGPS